MTWLDWTIIGIVALSTVVSLWRGFVREALSLLAWVVAFVVSTKFFGRFSQQLVEYIANDTLREVSAYFAATLMLGSLVNTLVAQVIRAAGLSGADRALGTVFGFARGLVLVLVVTFVLESTLSDDERAFMRDSRLLPHLAMIEQWAQRTFADVHIERGLAWPNSG